MIEPVSLTTAVATGTKIVGGISTALSSLKAARELAKDSKNSELKNELSDVYNAVLELRESVHDLMTENESLRKQLATRAAIRRESEYGYFYVEGDPDPLCPRCHERDGKQIHLDPLYTNQETGGTSRWCNTCSTTYKEKRGTGVASLPTRPLGWML